MIPDPRGRPSLSDQSPFSARRRSIVTRGRIIMKPPSVFSFCHPGCRNGNESLMSGQRVAAWPILPQEKHITSDQSLRSGRCLREGHCREGCHCRWRCPSRKEHNICSSVVGTGGFTAAGGRFSASLPSCCNSFDMSDISGF